MEDRLDTFPRLLLHHARVRPGHAATREKDLGIWQSWTWSAVVSTESTFGQFCTAAWSWPSESDTVS